MTNGPSQSDELSLNEDIWVEIIRTMENFYGELARTQIELEQKADDLRQANEFINNIIRSVADALVVCDAHGAITLVSRSCLALLGHTEVDMVGSQLSSVFDPRAENRVCPGTKMWRLLLMSGAIHNLETDLVSRAGERIPVSLSVSVMRDKVDDVIGVVLVATNLQEIQRLLHRTRAKAEELERAYADLKQLQARLIQSEKMSSLGRVAAGVAHEINNPLGGILIYSHIMLEGFPEGSREAKTLLKIIRETNRCKEIVKGLLGFSRTSQVERRTLDLGLLVETALKSVSIQPVFNDIEIEHHRSEQLMVIDGEEGPLHQALTNVLVNAAEAMGGKGRLTVRVWREPEHMANVAVSDTGPGIKEEQALLLFEPFFTTKEVGRGTGLGLAITYGVVRQHGGSITARNNPDGGAVFTMSFPLARDQGAP